MLAAAVTRRRVVDPARPLFHVRNELLERLDRQRGGDDEHAGLATDQRDRREVLDRVIGKLGIQRGADRIGLRREQKRVAVWRRLRHDVGADGRARAGLVVDDHLLAEPLRELLRDHAHRPVDRTARREGHDDAHRPRRIILRPRRGCAERNERRRGEDERRGRTLLRTEHREIMHLRAAAAVS